jgi:Uma2 family endonuclease
MDAVWNGVPESFLAERASLGLDRRDEVWEGVLHMVPSPDFQHNDLNVDLSFWLRQLAKRHGFVHGNDPMAVYAPDVDPKSWRVPDISIARPDQVSTRGFEGALLVVEVISPHDESRKKWGFWERVGVQEVWLIEPYTREPEIYVRADSGFTLVAPIGSVHHAPLLSITLEVIDGPKLRVASDDDRIEI